MCFINSFCIVLIGSVPNNISILGGMITIAEFTKRLESLNAEEQTHLMLRIDEMLTESALSLSSIQSEQVSAEGVCCPQCKSRSHRLNGKSAGVQLYVCKDCGKYYRATSGSLTSWLKKPHLLKTYFVHMQAGKSIRACAKATGISIQTSFDWRHKILAAFEKQQDMVQFSGILESDETFVAYSEKGKRGLERKPRKRGKGVFDKKKRGISDEKVAIIITADRKGTKHLQAATRGRISKKHIDKALSGKIAKGSVLCTDSHRSYTAFAKTEELTHEKIKVSAKQYKRGIYHVQHVNQQGKALKQFLEGFNGVSTKYLQNYLNWFALKDKIAKSTLPVMLAMQLALQAPEAWLLFKQIPNLAIIN